MKYLPELLPGQKVEIVRQAAARRQGGVHGGRWHQRCPLAGDGDRRRGDGRAGTDVAIEAADAVLLKDDLTRLPLLIYLAKRTRQGDLPESALCCGVCGRDGICRGGGLLWDRQVGVAADCRGHGAHPGRGGDRHEFGAAGRGRARATPATEPDGRRIAASKKYQDPKTRKRRLQRRSSHRCSRFNLRMAFIIAPRGVK